MRLLYCLALLVFCVFWLISTPIYFLTKCCEQFDVWWSRVMEKLWEGL